jgi:hypothetical protein
VAGSDGNPPTPTAYLQGSQRALQVYSSGLEPSAPGLATPHIDKMGHQVPKRHGKGRRRRFHGRVPVLLTDAIRLLMYNAFCLTHLLLTIPHLPCYATYRLEEHPPSRPLTNRSTLVDLTNRCLICSSWSNDASRFRISQDRISSVGPFAFFCQSEASPMSSLDIPIGLFILLVVVKEKRPSLVQGSAAISVLLAFGSFVAYLVGMGTSFLWVAIFFLVVGVLGYLIAIADKL